MNGFPEEREDISQNSKEEFSSAVNKQKGRVSKNTKNKFPSSIELVKP